MSQSVRVFAPASVSNVCCGFDIFGFALEEPGDEIIITQKNTPGLEIKAITGDGGQLPLDIEKNTASIAAQSFLKALGREEGIYLEIHKKMPLSSGMGSSAASAVAAAYAMNVLFRYPFSQEELLVFAMEAEGVISGKAHADNVAPCLFGGFTLVRSYDPLDVIQVPYPKNLFCGVVYPFIEVLTKQARAILKQTLSLEDHVIQSGNVAGLILGLTQKDYSLIQRSLEDVLIEPTRSRLVPPFRQIKAKLKDLGVLGCGLSGAGPAIFTLTEQKDLARKACELMQRECEFLGYDSHIYLSPISSQGVRVIK